VNWLTESGLRYDFLVRIIIRLAYLFIRLSHSPRRRSVAPTMARATTLSAPSQDRRLSYFQPVRGEFIESRGNRCLVQPATVLLPAIRGKAYRRPRSVSIWQAALYPRVRPVLIEILLKLSQLRLQVCGCPE
jgi:hypothetical protein